jgi:hypothetical protein
MMARIPFLLVGGSGVPASNFFTVPTASRTDDTIWACVNPIAVLSFRKAFPCIASDHNENHFAGCPGRHTERNNPKCR